MTFTKLLEGAAAPVFLDRRAPWKITVGVVLSLIPVISFFALGYVLSVFLWRMLGQSPEELPEWKDPGQLFVRGTVFFMVILSYCAVPFLFTSASFSMLKLGFVFVPPAVVTLVLAAALWLAAIYIMPLGLALMMRRRTVAAVFDLPTIWQQSLGNLAHYLQATLLNLALIAAVSLPAVYHPAGYLLSSPLTFLAMLYLALVYGSICAEAPSRG